jgi:hypothetical protein
MPKRKVDWPKLQQEYLSDSTSTYESLALKHGIPLRSVSWHGRREQWRLERSRHCTKVVDLLSAESASNSVRTVLELNERHLHRSEDLRTLLDQQLGSRGVYGELVPRENLTITEILRVVKAFGLLFRFDRIALGADQEMLMRPPDKYESMTLEELEEELRRVCARNIIH